MKESEYIESFLRYLREVDSDFIKSDFDAANDAEISALLSGK